MSDIIIDSAYFGHDSGTKFYEINSFANADDNTFILVKRYGSSTASRNGGAIKIEHEVNREYLKVAFNNAIRDRLKRKAGNGGFYEKMESSSHIKGSGIATGDHIKDLIERHYKPMAASQVLEALTMTISAEKPNFIVRDPVKEPVREGDWGSW